MAHQGYLPRRHVKSILMVSTAIGSCNLATVARAQTEPPPPSVITDGRGVDLVSGEVAVGGVDVSIGGVGETGLEYRRLDTKFRSNHDVVLATTLPIYGSGPAGFRVYIGGDSYGFDLGFNAAEKDGTSLTYDSATYTYTFTNRDGDRYLFSDARWQGNPYNWNINGLSLLVVDKVIFASGVVWTYHRRWQKSCISSGGSCNLDNPDPNAGSYRWNSRLQSVTSSAGYQLKFDYETNSFSTYAEQIPWSRLIRVTAINNAVEFCDPNADGCSLQRSWPFAVYTSDLFYQGANNEYRKAVDAAGRTTEVFITNNNRTTSVRLPGSTGISYESRAGDDGRVTSLTAFGGVWTYTYGKSPILGGSLLEPDLATIKSPTGEESETAIGYFWDSASPLSNYTRKPVLNRDAGGAQTLSTYQDNGYGTPAALKRTERSDGMSTSLEYDALGHITQTSIAPATGSPLAAVSSRAEYQNGCASPASCHKPLSQTDPRGNRWDFTYDPIHGGLLTATGPADNDGTRVQRRYEYTLVYPSYLNASGQTISAPGPVYRLATISECIRGSSCVGTADERRTVFTYGGGSGSNGILPTRVTIQSGDGAVVSTRDYSYDIYGNISSIDGPLPGSADTTYFQYNQKRELVARVLPDPDGSGPLRRLALRYVYGDAGDVVRVDKGVVNGITDVDIANLEVRESVMSLYDGASRRKIRETFVTGQEIISVRQFSYDSAGRLTCVANRMNPSTYGSLPADACALGLEGSDGPDHIVRITYDLAGRPKEKQSGFGTDTPIIEATDFDSFNRLVSVRDGKGNETTYTYDGFGRLATTNYVGGTSEQLSYDTNGNVIQRRLRDGQLINLEYDGLDRVVKKTSGNEQPIYFSYDLQGRPRTIARPADGVTETLIYDALGRLLSEGQPFGTLNHQYDAAGKRVRTTWQDGFFVTYDYDNLGNMTVIREYGSNILASYSYDDLSRRISLTLGNGAVTNYQYDSASRLATMSQDLAGSDADLTRQLRYNTAGQISQLTSSNDRYAWRGLTTVDREYTVNGLNQYTSAGATGFGYDSRGNLTTSGTTSYGYDADNQLRSSSDGVSLHYDVLQRLIEYNASTSTRFVYDGPQMMTEVANPSGAILRRYVYGPGADEPVVWYEGSGTGDKRYLHADERGSVIAVSDQSGSVLAINSYDEHGIPSNSSNGALGPYGRFGFTGQAWLPGLNLYYFKARIYSPSLGRYMQADPTGYADGINWYNYAQSDPINNIDPSGLDTVSRAGESEPPVPPDVVVLGDRIPLPDVSELTLPLERVELPGASLANDILAQAVGGTTTCVGPATTTGVGGRQAMADGALYSKYPALAGGSIKGGTFGTVGVQKGFLGLSTRQLRTYGTQITVSFSDSQRSVDFGGPAVKRPPNSPDRTSHLCKSEEYDRQ